MTAAGGVIHSGRIAAKPVSRARCVRSGRIGVSSHMVLFLSMEILRPAAIDSSHAYTWAFEASSFSFGYQSLAAGWAPAQELPFHVRSPTIRILTLP